MVKRTTTKMYTKVHEKSTFKLKVDVSTAIKKHDMEKSRYLLSNYDGNI